MPLIPEAVIDDIQVRVDIAELIGRYVPLKRAGRHWKANCPFHKERTPSFMVNPEKQVFHCFGCGVGGNIFSFLMQHDRVTFPEAVRLLADQIGVRLPEQAEDAGVSAFQRLGPLMEKACQYFERVLAHPAQGRHAREYLDARGVSDGARRNFRLGLAPDGWNRLLTAARTGGLTVQDLEALGLIIQGDARPYDRFRNRLIFPIMDLRGRIVGFGGRSLDGREPKYLNSPETALYHKGHHLFGMAQAKEAIAELKTAVVVEGYFDCVVLAAAGVSRVVSPLGTALTSEQARLLKRYADRVILAFDGDAAGDAAALKGIDLLVELGVEVRVARLPSGTDPDEYARAHGRQGLERLLDRSVTIFEFLVEAAAKRHPLRTREEKVRVAQFVLPTVAKVPSAMLRSEYVRLIAQRFGLDEQAVSRELAGGLGQGRAPQGSRETGAARPSMLGRRPDVRAMVEPRRVESSSGLSPWIQGPERLLTALVLDDPSRWAAVKRAVPIEAFTDPMLQRIVTIIDGLDPSTRPIGAAQVISRLSEEGAGGVVSELVELARSLASRDAAFEDGLRRLRVTVRKRQLDQLRERLRLAQESGREAEARRLLVEYQELVAYHG